MVSFFPSFISVAHGASPLLQACIRDLEMPHWVASNLQALTVMVGYSLGTGGQIEEVRPGSQQTRLSGTATAPQSTHLDAHV